MSNEKNGPKVIDGTTLQEVPESDLAPVKRRDVYLAFADAPGEGGLVKSEKPKEEKEEVEIEESLTKSLLNILDGESSISRLAFETDPAYKNNFAGLYRIKRRLIPDLILKRISIQDDLVASIINTRANHLLSFGRRQPNRFEKGFVLTPKPGVEENLSDEQMEELSDRIDKLAELIETCGTPRGYEIDDQMTFAQFLYMSTKDAVTVGRVATEAVYALNPSGKRVFHSFRPIDAGTIYRTVGMQSQAESVRRQALHLLEEVRGEKLVPEDYIQDKYTYVQVIEDRPWQAFTSEECLVHNFYPTTQVELDGFPITPIDTVISAVTMHINITTHNKLYFQNGRATRGMLVIKSEDADERTVTRIKQQFNASINAVSGSWRMPVFAVGPQDDITWASIDSGGRDMEFQYLADSNARTILSAFQMSPEELPGWAHLSRGTNSQALAESNTEWKLLAARDVGIRPLLKQWEDFINARLLPLLDANLAKLVDFQFVGLDAETAEKESIRIQQDMPVHMTYDEVLAKVEKEPLGKELGGEYPLNPTFQAVQDKFLTVGEIKEKMFGIEGASKDPQWAYVRDPFWFQWQEFQFQTQQAQQQQQMMQQQAQMQAQQGGDPNAQGQPPPEESELGNAVDQAGGELQKAEDKLPEGPRKLLAQHAALLDHFEEGWQKDVEDATKAILEAVSKKRRPRATPKKKE